MKLFIDSADIDEIKKAWEWGILDGITTNPSLTAKTGMSFKETVKEIFKIVDGVINLEVVALKYDKMIDEAHKLADLDGRVVVKLPNTPDGIRAVKKLTSEGIRTNVTLTFSLPQALLAAKAGAKYVSPFLGRLEEIGEEGTELIAEILKVYDNYNFTTQVLAASIRTVDHVKQVALLGAHVATCPYNILEQLFHHPLTDKGLDKFMQDWKESGQSL